MQHKGVKGKNLVCVTFELYFELVSSQLAYNTARFMLATAWLMPGESDREAVNFGTALKTLIQRVSHPSLVLD